MVRSFSTSVGLIIIGPPNVVPGGEVLSRRIRVTAIQFHCVSSWSAWPGPKDPAKVHLRHGAAWYPAARPPRICTGTSAKPPWSHGERYVFLDPQVGHFRRSSYSSRALVWGRGSIGLGPNCSARADGVVKP
jgi:hypothetical protein